MVAEEVELSELIRELVSEFKVLSEQLLETVADDETKTCVPDTYEEVIREVELKVIEVNLLSIDESVG